MDEFTIFVRKPELRLLTILCLLFQVLSCGNMTYRTIAEITELQYEYKGEWERASADNRDIDWEQRRYEIAKELMKGFASNPHDQCADASCETLAQWSISGADALITELKKEVNNDTEASI